MFVRLALSLVCVATIAGSTLAIAAEPAPLTPFSADYQVLRNDKELGHATLSLRKIDENTWEFSSTTHGTAGMAKMLGLDVVEKSTFRWHDGRPEGLSYQYSQQAAIKSKQRDITFDWRTRQATTNEGKADSVAALKGGETDRNAVTVGLMAQLKNGGTDLSFAVVDKDKISTQQYEQQGAHETLSLPAGNIDTVRVDRQREDSKRTTTIWFAPQRNWLPVQIEQVEKKGDTVTMRMISSH